MSKLLKGGNIGDPYLQLQTYISMIILGYFGVKIIYGSFFKFYPEKFYYRNIEINTSESSSDDTNTKNIALNAYMPGLWNTEITDFVVTIILSFVIYVYTNMSTRAMIKSDGNLHTALLIGYIIGLGYPPFQKTIDPLLKVDSNNNLGRKVLLCFSWGLFILILVTIILANYITVSNDYKTTISYTTFIAVLILLLFGLFIARKSQQTVGPITYYFSNSDQCKTKSNKYIMSSGDVVKLSPTFCSFILLLLFSYDPEDLGWKFIYIMGFGILLGVFVSSLSYYGIEYFLIKQPIKQCNTASECGTVLNEEDYEGNMNDELEKINESKNSLNIIKLIMIIALIIVIAYLILMR